MGDALPDVGEGDCIVERMSVKASGEHQTHMVVTRAYRSPYRSYS